MKKFVKPNILLGVAAFAVFFAAMQLIFGTIAPTMIFFGLPCPACGMTRAGLYFLRGDFSGSFAMHPLLVPGAAFCAAWVALRFLRPDRIKVLQVPGIILLVIFLAVYVYRMVSFFPDEPPMVVNENSVLHMLRGILMGAE